MRLLAYGMQTHERITARLWHQLTNSGMCITSPPCGEPVPYSWLEGYDAIYIDLHGEPSDVFLMGDSATGQMVKALNLLTVRRADIGGAVVFLTTCYLPETGFIDAFLDAGASAVIGGAGENWGGRLWPQGAQRLGLYFLELYAKDVPVEYCLKCAKHRLRWDVAQRVMHPKATMDALEFKLWRREL